MTKRVSKDPSIRHISCWVSMKMYFWIKEKGFECGGISSYIRSLVEEEMEKDKQLKR